MNQTLTQVSIEKSRFRSLLATKSPVYYGVGTIIMLTLAYSFLHVIPMIRNDLRQLNELNSVDMQAIRLEASLRSQVEESRRDFLRVVTTSTKLHVNNPEIRELRESDAAVAATQAQISQLGLASAVNLAHFQQDWQSYLTQRDQLLLAVVAGGEQQARSADPALGKTTYDAANRSAEEMGDAFQAATTQRINAVSTTLRNGMRELIGLCIFKLVVLSSLLWIDLRRVRAEVQLQRATRDLRASEERFRQAYESASVGMGIFRLDGTVLSANRKAEQILGVEPGEMIGRKVTDIMAPESREDVVQRFARDPAEADGNYQVERKIIRKDGSVAWVSNSVTLLHTEGQEPQYFSISQEITHQKEANERLAFLANFDPITNLPNRHYFEEQLVASLQPVMGNDSCVALLYVEIDSFDFLKGTFGRTVADEVLSELGCTLTAFRREGELVARLDDHVFGVLVKAAPYDEATLSRAAELRDIFHRSSGASKHRIPLSASIGVAFSHTESGGSAGGARKGAKADADILLKYARAAMLEARSRGGDSIYLADPGLQERAAQRHQIESALLHGIREDEFRVVFQPQFEVASGKLVRFEALCRWTSKELGPIPPDRFIPIAEQTGLITEIGRRILHDALRQAKVWTDSGRRIGVAVNISPMQFMRPDFTQAVTEALALTSFPPALLELEITEGIFIRDLNLAVARIRELQRLGLSIALDDFGTGYSSLSYLQRMPIDAVKLDRSFVSELTTNPATVSMVRSVLAMADALNLRVVTEGVETEQQMEVLRTLGCDEAQGYLLGRPESSEMALQRVLESPMRPVGTLA
jgi:PAS domain S-box-containing protein/diguanylate cyclase (GGDEF)-like protein